MKKSRIAILAIIVVIVASYAFSSPYDKPQAKHKLSDAAVIRILKDAGYTAIKKAKDGLILVEIDEMKYAVSNSDDGDLLAHYAIHGEKLSYEDINKWNQYNRMSRGYIDSSADLVIEAD